MKRLITEQEKRIYKLCHHEFDGITTAEAVKEMKISIDKAKRLLKNLKKKAPQLFPILTHRQHLIYWLYTEKGLTEQKIADYLNTICTDIESILNRLKKKGMPFLKSSGLGDIISYEKEMDNHIIHKF